MRTNKFDAYKKIKKSIASCKNCDQLVICDNMLDKYFEMFPDAEEEWDDLFELLLKAMVQLAKSKP